MSSSSIIFKRVIYAWGAENGPFLVEFLVRGARGGPWEIFASRDQAGAAAGVIRTADDAEGKMVAAAEVLPAYPLDDEPTGLTAKILGIPALLEQKSADIFFVVDQDGRVTTDCLVDKEQARRTAGARSRLHKEPGEP